jgi:hypothetical protein
MKSFDDYKGILPYASELFGIYQPLLGWKSQIISKRYERFRLSLYNELAARALVGARSPVQIKLSRGPSNVVATATGALSFNVSHLASLDLDRASEPHVSATIDCGIARMILTEIGEKPPKKWNSVINRSHVNELLKKFQSIVSSPDELRKHPDLSDYVATFSKAYTQDQTHSLLEELFDKECKVSGYLLFLAEHTPSSLDSLFFQNPNSALLAAAQVEDPLLNFGANNYEAILSPIGVIHLFREYFFEFDSFLGPPVGHVWLSPGGTVELIEVSTRKTVTEKTFEESIETTTKSETSVTTQDDIADAVKEENRDNIKFGFTNTASYSSPVFSDTATADLSIDHAKTTSRETTHKQMRQQSEKLSSEIKRNFKTTFKTSMEITDTSSKRYVIQNTTDKLVNYELRRKMRKVGVQAQHIGMKLGWHTFVDDAGRDLGVGKLVHIGQPPELSDLVQPDAPPMPTAQTQDVSISIPFVGIDTDDTDNAYTDGTETEVGLLDSEEHIQADFDQRVIFMAPGYTLAAVDLDPQGTDAKLSVRNLQSADGSSSGTFTLHIDYVNWNGQNQIPTKVTLHWDPSQSVRDAATAEYNARMTAYNNEKSRRYKEVFYAAARERIKLASQITPRPAEDLREEERTVVYRALISQLMSVGTHQSKHVVSELVRSIFDVDSMLYFVAPEWWAPRLHRSAQHLGEEPGTSTGSIGPKISPVATGLFMKLSGVVSTFGSTSRGTPIGDENIVDWGGAKELNRDNYYITEESTPAKLGASLGWLLQLDGDNLRNAFLNSPWVKAVIPIRIGKEHAALNWLKQAHVEGSDGLNAAYNAKPDDPPELQGTTIEGAIDVLIDKIQEFDHKSRTPIIGNPADPEDASSHFAGSLPTEAVFEHGFYPLKGGVHFDGDGTEWEIFSQWMEILPTDQVAALAVEYDPKTLQVKEDEPS